MTRVSGGAAAEVLVWWILLCVLGFCLISTIDRAETAVVVGTALVGAVACTVARRAQGVRFGRPAGTARPLLRAAASVLPDAARLAYAVTRALRGDGAREGLGHLRALQLGNTGDEDVELSRRAVLTLALSTSPGSYVTGIADDGITYVHELGGDAASIVGREGVAR